MNLAVAVTPEQPCPPPKYGGNEKQADILVRKLLDRGHAVDLFAAPGSRCPATRSILAKNAGMRSELLEFMTELQRLKRKNWEYDCIIDMTAFHLPGQTKNLTSISIMTGDPYKKYPHDNVENRVYVSKEFAAFNNCPDHPILHNIIHEDPASVPIGTGGGGYALYVGTIREGKGIHFAAAACKELGLPLVVGGPVLEPEYFKTFQADVKYIGVVDGNSDAKWNLFSRAEVFVYPIQWCDAGPLAPMEAMLVGTPVVSCPNGGIISDLEDGKNGVFWAGFKALVECIRDCRKLDRQKVRASILPNIDPDKHADTVVELCKRAAGGERW